MYFFLDFLVDNINFNVIEGDSENPVTKPEQIA